MAIVVASGELPGHRDHGLGVGLLYQDQEKRLIEEAEHHMDHFVGVLVEDNHLGMDLVDLVEDLEELAVVAAWRVVVMGLAHLVVAGEEPDLDLLEMLDQPLYLQKGYLDHVQSQVVLGMEQRVVVDHPSLVDERSLLFLRVRGEVVKFHHHIYKRQQH